MEQVTAGGGFRASDPCVGQPADAGFLMAETKTGTNTENVASDHDVSIPDTEMTLRQWQQINNGNLPSFESPAQLNNWFDAQLVQIYAEVVSEPLPREFLDLLEKLREKDKDKGR
jgi:anti-sigma factor NepR-like protein